MLSIALLDDLQLSRNVIKCLLEDWCYNVDILASDGMELYNELIINTVHFDICVINVAFERNYMQPILDTIIHRYPMSKFVFINKNFTINCYSELFTNRIVSFDSIYIRDFKNLLLSLGRFN